MPTSNPFSELLERKRVLLPTLLSIVFVASLFLLAAAGQQRITESNEQVQAAESRAHDLSDLMSAIVDAESAMRGYVITGDSEYLEPVVVVRRLVATRLADLDQAYATLPVADRDLESLRRLIEARLGLIEQFVEQRKLGFEPAAQLVRSNVGRRTMEQLREVVAAIEALERRLSARSSQQAHTDLMQGLWLLAVGALLNMLLVALAGALISRDLRRRSNLAAELENQRQSLEQQVTLRTAELAELSTHLQTAVEAERSSLARELHDELGSLLVAARMDLSWLQRRLPTEDSNLKLRWQRIHDQLDAGVNLKRRVVEQLRPTLLDNMGLYAALRWQLQESCGRAGLRCTERYPDPELSVSQAASIAIFRIVQEACTNILKHAQAMSVDLALDVDLGDLVIRITDDGIGIRQERKIGPGSHGLAAMRHRVAKFGGTCQIESGESGGTAVTIRLALDKVQAPTDISVEGEQAESAV